MKKYLIGIMCIGFIGLAGCAHVSYKSTGTETTLTYDRLGMMKLDGFEMTTDEKGIKSVKFNKSEGSAGDLAEAVLNLTNKIP